MIWLVAGTSALKGGATVDSGLTVATGNLEVTAGTTALKGGATVDSGLTVATGKGDHQASCAENDQGQVPWTLPPVF